MLKWVLTTKQIPIDVQFDSKVSKLQACRRQRKQLDLLKYLLRQGMAIRGHAEKDGNLYHLLFHMAKYDSDLQQWIDDYRYMSHDIITELIALMGQRLLRQILHNIQQVSPPWYGLMADEASDAANKEHNNQMGR